VRELHSIECICLALSVNAVTGVVVGWLLVNIQAINCDLSESPFLVVVTLS